MGKMITFSFLSSLFWLSRIRVSGFSNSILCNEAISTRLNGIAEWRDFPSGITFDGDNHDEAYDILNYGSSARRVPVVCVTPGQAVLQGEKKYIQFHSNDELRIFQQAFDRNHGIFALGVIISEHVEKEESDEIVMSKLQLMEIKDYNMNLGVDFGIFCTAQAVGKATLLSLLSSEQHSSGDEEKAANDSLIAICEERFDRQETHFTIEDANEIAKSVLQLMTQLSDTEQENSDDTLSNNHDVRILRDVNNSEEEDYDDYEDTRYCRFAHAYLESLDSDSHGYISNEPMEEGMLSWKEMNAISWAAFSSDLIPSEEGTMRLHAFDQDRVIDRLKLASYWLADILEEVKQKSSSRK